MPSKKTLQFTLLAFISLGCSGCKALELFDVQNSSGMMLFWQISIVVILIAGLPFYQNYKQMYAYCHLVENNASREELKMAKEKANKALFINSIIVILTGICFVVPMLFSGPNLMFIPFLILAIYMHFYNKSLRAFRTVQPKKAEPTNEN
ncbi:MAG: hypothetical protein GY810_01730 [Aureispira sp.]|nr:hypothetical protein [Aureispira sp.]